jgi:hypothetical protein
VWRLGYLCCGKEQQSWREDSRIECFSVGGNKEKKKMMNGKTVRMGRLSVGREVGNGQER